jgi:hypothetical protein
MTRFTGGCACGAARYEFTADPKFSYLCQCRDCQKVTGSGHAALMMFDVQCGDLSGELKYFDSIGESGNTISRGFCPHCGSPTIARISTYPEVWFVFAASLDNPESFKPTRILWHSSAQPWDTVDLSLRIHAKGV